MNKVSIVVPVRNAPREVENLLRGLDSTEAKDIPTVFVDDSSEEETRNILKQYLLTHYNAQYLRTQSQQWFSRTVNVGLRGSIYSDFYMILNTDCDLYSNWLNALLEAFDRHRDAGVIGYGDGEPKDYPDEQVTQPGLYVTGHAVMVRRQVFDKIGLFIETNPDWCHIGSDSRLSQDSRAVGFESWYLHKPYLGHIRGGASWQRNTGLLAKNVFDYGTLTPGRDTW